MQKVRQQRCFLDSISIVNRNFFEGIKDMVLCSICTGVFVEPVKCSSCDNAFCKFCINQWGENSSYCPFMCENFEILEASRTLKNLLDKLVFKCQNYCSGIGEYSYSQICQHLSICGNLIVTCPSCNSNVKNSQLQELEEINILKKRITQLENKVETLENKNLELTEQLEILNKSSNNLKSENRKNLKHHSLNSEVLLKSLPFNLSEKSREQELGLIDKCQHFKGNYKPIFDCCNKAFACYLCHELQTNHTYEYSNKVVCLICSNIYMGEQCTNCGAKQLFKQKK